MISFIHETRCYTRLTNNMANLITFPFVLWRVAKFFTMFLVFTEALSCIFARRFIRVVSHTGELVKTIPKLTRFEDLHLKCMRCNVYIHISRDTCCSVLIFKASLFIWQLFCFRAHSTKRNNDPNNTSVRK